MLLLEDECSRVPLVVGVKFNRLYWPVIGASRQVETMRRPKIVSECRERATKPGGDRESKRAARRSVVGRIHMIESAGNGDSDEDVPQQHRAPCSRESPPYIRPHLEPRRAAEEAGNHRRSGARAGDGQIQRFTGFARQSANLRGHAKPRAARS